MIKKGKFVLIDLNDTCIGFEVVSGKIEVSINGDNNFELKMIELEAIINALDDLTVK